MIFNRKVLLTTGFVILAACNGSGSGGAKKAEEIVRPLADDVVILEHKGGKITAKDVNARLEPQIKQMAEEILENYRKGAEEMLVVKLLESEAKKQGLSSPDELLSRVAGAEVTDAEVSKFMKDNNLEKGIKDPRTGKTRQVSKDEVRGFLSEQATRKAQQEFFAKVRNDAGVKFKLEKPKVNIPSTGKEPFKGGSNAKVVIHEFSDFQCPFCARGKTVVDQIAAAYGDKVKIIFRHMPLNFHPEAKPSAMAAMCANEQGKFWEFHDKAFDNQQALGTASYKAWAKELGLDTGKFDKCFDEKATLALVEADEKAAESLGVNSTPTFFVNGRKVAGALPFEQFKQMIDEELAN